MYHKHASRQDSILGNIQSYGQDSVLTYSDNWHSTVWFINVTRSQSSYANRKCTQPQTKDNFLCLWYMYYDCTCEYVLKTMWDSHIPCSVDQLTNVFGWLKFIWILIEVQVTDKFIWILIEVQVTDMHICVLVGRNVKMFILHVHLLTSPF